MLTGRLDLDRSGLFGVSMGVNAYSVAFFDRYLLGAPGALLDEPADRHPGVLVDARRH